jgi:NAD(P)-dependent dehydrogenase (short-subunit alcohol dehydrogenase family)
VSKPERVLVTGASRGIGRGVAEQLLREGRRVVLAARHGERLAEVAAVAPARAAVLVSDVAHDEGLVARACVPFGGLDGLVHAAGVAPHRPLHAITDADLDVTWSLHVRAPLRATQALAAHLAAEGRPGAIVHVASTLALRPTLGTLAYAMSKAALVALTQGAALELAPQRLRVNAVAPGVVETDMTRALRLAPGEAVPAEAEREARVQAQLEGLRRLHPLGRLGTIDDVAAAIVYLLDAEWVTGTVLTIDGGLLLGA